MDARTQNSHAIRIAHDGDAPVVFSPADFDRFVLTQRESLQAATDMIARKRIEGEIGDRIAAWVFRLHEWCKAHSVGGCAVAPRMDDLMVVIIARDEDPDGRLHDAMSAFDLEAFQKNNLRLSWLLLRASEATGLHAFVNPKMAKWIYSADKQAA